MLSDDEFIKMVSSIGTENTSRRLGISSRVVRKRSQRLRERGETVALPNGPYQSFPTRIPLTMSTGVVLVASDCHYWPGHITTAHRAFVRACGKFKPSAIIMNGDVFDGASISRHPPIGWSRCPTVLEEIETCQDRLAEIVSACPAAKRFWAMGHHDIRGRCQQRRQQRFDCGRIGAPGHGQHLDIAKSEREGRHCRSIPWRREAGLHQFVDSQSMTDADARIDIHGVIGLSRLVVLSMCDIWLRQWLGPAPARGFVIPSVHGLAGRVPDTHHVLFHRSSRPAGICGRDRGDDFPVIIE